MTNGDNDLLRRLEEDSKQKESAISDLKTRLSTVEQNSKPSDPIALSRLVIGFTGIATFLVTFAIAVISFLGYQSYTDILIQANTIIKAATTAKDDAQSINQKTNNIIKSIHGVYARDLITSVDISFSNIALDELTEDSMYYHSISGKLKVLVDLASLGYIDKKVLLDARVLKESLDAYIAKDYNKTITAISEQNETFEDFHCIHAAALFRRLFDSNLKSVDKQVIAIGFVREADRCVSRIGGNRDKRMRAQIMRGASRLLVGKRDEAFNIYKSLHDEYPNTCIAQFNYAAFLVEDKKYDDATIIFKKVQKICDLQTGHYHRALCEEEKFKGYRNSSLFVDEGMRKWCE